MRGYYVASTKFAINGNVEKRQITRPTFDLKLGPDVPDVLRPERRLSADNLSLIPRDMLRDVLTDARDIGHSDLLS